MTQDTRCVGTHKLVFVPVRVALRCKEGLHISLLVVLHGLVNLLRLGPLLFAEAHAQADRAGSGETPATTNLRLGERPGVMGCTGTRAAHTPRPSCPKLLQKVQ